MVDGDAAVDADEAAIAGDAVEAAGGDATADGFRVDVEEEGELRDGQEVLGAGDGEGIRDGHRG